MILEGKFTIEAQIQVGEVFSKDIRKKIQVNIQKAFALRVWQFDCRVSIFEVEEIYDATNK